MTEKLKAYLNNIQSYALAILTAVAGIAMALLFRQKKKTEQVESELAGAITNTEIKLNDQAREAAKENADALIADYARKRAEYDENRTGGGS